MPILFFILLIIFPVIAQAELEYDDTWIKNLPPTVPQYGQVTCASITPGIKQSVFCLSLAMHFQMSKYIKPSCKMMASCVWSKFRL